MQELLQNFDFFEKAFPEVLKRSNYIGMLQNLDPENISQGTRKPRKIGWVFGFFFVDALF